MKILFDSMDINNSIRIIISFWNMQQVVNCSIKLVSEIRSRRKSIGSLDFRTGCWYAGIFGTELFQTSSGWNGRKAGEDWMDWVFFFFFF